MRFDYFFDTSEKALTSFFSEKVLSFTRVSIFLAAGCLICFWPFQTSFASFGVKGTPLTFPVVFIFSLVWVSHFLLMCGKGETLDDDSLLKYRDKDLQTHEETFGLFNYTLPGFLFHTVFIHLVLLPVYVVSAAVSGISPSLFMVSLAVLFFSSLVARLLGFLSYLLFGYWSLCGFLFSRALFVAFFFLSGLIRPALNPVYLIFQVYSRHQYNAFEFADVQVYMIWVFFLLAGITLLCQALVHKKKRAGKDGNTPV